MGPERWRLAENVDGGRPRSAFKMGCHFGDTLEVMRQKCDFCTCAVFAAQAKGHVPGGTVAQADVAQGPCIERIEFVRPAQRRAPLQPGVVPRRDCAAEC